ncbi:hypothetical protein AB1L42_21775 [Thalassoglobus sp. JC818]|uniref:hypothetical protein n=1 Tax=Thalassoglobus sp. JC818 TaxID=3232136 RepID=UPI0034581092
MLTVTEQKEGNNIDCFIGIAHSNCLATGVLIYRNNREFDWIETSAIPLVSF